MRIYRGYLGIMAKEMETTITGHIISSYIGISPWDLTTAR